MLTEHAVPIAPRTFHAWAVRAPSKRALWDATITEILAGYYEPDEHGRRRPESLYGSLKMWAHLQREGIPVAKSTVERLMRKNGWQGVRRQKRVRTTIPDPEAVRPPDLVDRQFGVAAPNVLLVADFTYVKLVTGVFVYVAFVIDAYAGSITWTMTGDFSGYVEATYKHAEEIETGRPARDLKKMLDTSMKVRQAKDGSRYLIIPFRHNTPGNDAHAPSMSPAVYAQAKMLTASTITGHGRRQSGNGSWSLSTKAPATVRQRKYNWGDRLMGAGIAKNQQGMVKMDTGTSGKKGSQFLTFRVMSEKSNGWIQKAQPGQNILSGVVQEMQPVAESFMSEAIKRSLG